MAERPDSQPHDVPAFDLYIDRLVLHGFKPADRIALTTAIERELARLFTSGGVPVPILERGRAEGDLTVHRLDAGSFDLPHDASPDTVGVQAARVIHQVLGGVPGAGRVAGPNADQHSVPTPHSGGASL